MIVEHQVELDLSHRTPEARAAMLESLLAYLARAAAWRSAAEIRRDTALPERVVRDLASGCPEILSGPGCPGYRLLRQSTPEEVGHATAAMLHQAKMMHDRALGILREWHRMSPASTVPCEVEPLSVLDHLAG